MATQTIEFAAPSGQTITAKLFAAGSDTVAATASSVTERSNATGVYTATVTSTLAGVYRLVATNAAGTLLAQWWVRLANATGDYVAYETPNADYLDATVSSRSTFAGGAVASVTGNVGGNVVGSVGSISGVTFPTHFQDLEIAANGHVSAAVQSIANNSITASSIQGGAITAAKFGTDAITAAALAADAVTEIQAGLATSANQTTIIDRVTYGLTALVGACSDAQTAAETYTLTIGGSTYTVDYSGLDASGNRSTTTLSKV
jgi:hypothetical protein